MNKDSRIDKTIEKQQRDTKEEDDVRVVVITRAKLGFTRDVYGFFNSYGAALQWADKNIPQSIGVDYKPLTVVAELAETDEVARLKRIVERERNASATWLGRIRAEVNRRRVLSESRGPYEWDDAAYFKEFGTALDAIEAAVCKAVKDTGADNFSDCPTTTAEVQQALNGARQVFARITCNNCEKLVYNAVVPEGMSVYEVQEEIAPVHCIPCGQSGRW
jgi:hypothetical protein